MKTQLSLTELAGELERRSSVKRDFVVDTNAIRLTPSGTVNMGEDGDIQTFSVNETAHGQIADRLGIPVKYYNRMREVAPELLTQNVNHWFGAQRERRLVRTLDGTMRAFLSDRYQRIENEEIAQVVLPILLNEAGVEVKSCAVTETRMHIKAVFTRVRQEVKVGDVVEAGIAISNSEVGKGSVLIQPLIHRLVCSNGLIVNDAKMSARHVGGRIQAGDEVYELLSDETIAADDRAILLKVRDVVRASFDEAIFGQRVQKMRDATEDRIQGDVTGAVKELGKKLSFTEGEQNNILRHLIEGADLSRYGLLNAVTRASQDVEDYDRATELEEAGGKILDLPRRDWQVISEVRAAA